jgi:hypothetical protein
VPPLELDALNRRGASIRCAVTATPLHQEGEIGGAIVLMQRVSPDDDPDDPPPRRRRSTPRRGEGRP